MRKLSVAVAAVVLAATSVGVSAADGNWDGTWSGNFGKQNPWAMTVVIAGGKVVSFAERGVPFDVRFSNVTATGVVFGDRLNYLVELSRRGADVAAGQIHGRFGIGPAHLTRG